jgi:hypothetical protein
MGVCAWAIILALIFLVIGCSGGGGGIHDDTIRIEIDWMDDSIDCGFHSHRPTDASLNLVREMFANRGVTVIFDVSNRIEDRNGVISGQVNSTEYLFHRRGNKDHGRDWHYAIFTHAHDGGDASGSAEEPGNDMIISTGCNLKTFRVAAVTGHELGHNLGLAHGGFEEKNFKPNYSSIMNYRYGNGIDWNCDRNPDFPREMSYSDGTRPPLDERALIEAHGVCGEAVGIPVDWNFNGVIDTEPVAVDINRFFSEPDGILEILYDYDDWENVLMNETEGVATSCPDTGGEG